MVVLETCGPRRAWFPDACRFCSTADWLRGYAFAFFLWVNELTAAIGFERAQLGFHLLFNYFSSVVTVNGS